MRGLVRTVFVGMLREEWRLHAQLFGGARFGAFPLFVAALGAGATWLLVSTGTAVASIVAGLHALAFLFGLHTGTIGFVGRDAVRNVLGDVTFIVFTSRTLPTSPRRLVGIFLVKDAVYYAALFLFPLSLAVAAVASVSDPRGATDLLSAPILWLTVTVTFVLGTVVTFGLVALATRLPGPVIGAGVVMLGAAGWLAGIDPVAVSPYGFYLAPGLGSAVRALLPVVAVGIVGLLAYDPTHDEPDRTATARFRRWRDRFGDPDGLLTKSLLDVARSSGGLWKVLFSAGVLFAVAAFLVGVVERLTGVEPSTGVSFGALLGLTAFTTYNWLTQFDSMEAHGRLPLPTSAVFRAKSRAFVLLGAPTALAYYGLAAALYGGQPVELVAGGILSLGVLSYLYGLTVALAGFEPNEFLFDTLLFAAFAVAVSLGLVPVLIVGFVLHPLSPTLLAGVAGWGITLSTVGWVLYRRAVPRWQRRYRHR